jgi:hypothetical protein
MIPQLERETTVASPDVVPKWSLASRIGFRFAFSYFLLYVAPGPVGSLGPYRSLEALNASIWTRIWHPIVLFVGTHILHLSGDLGEFPTGSGDELYDYVLILCLAVTAAVITAVWSWLDRRRPNYIQLNEWLRLLMRMTLGWAMLGYGVKKLLGAQFPRPSLTRLMQPFGQASPLGMLWAFMGASQPYSVFGGAGETLGGALVLVPRLVTLGALVSLAMTTNVLMLNLCYDVPRKILSIHLLLMCLYLLVPDLRRLTNFFLLNRRAEPRPGVPLFKEKLLQWGAMALPILFGAYVAFAAGQQSISDRKDLAATLPAPIRGIWSVNQFLLDGVPVVPRTGDPYLWQNVIFDDPKILDIQVMNGMLRQYDMLLDNAGKTVSLKLADDPKWHATLTVEFSRPDRMILQGGFGSHQMKAILDRINLSDQDRFLLVNRGYHWVNPFVNNR